MRTFIAFILSCTSVLGAGNGIRVVTTVKTNAETSSIYTTDVFTRDGQTNLLRTTKTKAGKLQIRIQKFYYGGVLVGNYVAMKDSSGLSTEAGIPYSLTFEFGPSNQLKSAAIGSNDGFLLDAFSCTNGLFYPKEAFRIQQVNDLLRGTVGGEPVSDTDEWMKKYKEKYKIP